MNEVTTIHLGREAFTISVAAHRALREYLDAIGRRIPEQTVVDEIELRMAELLREHGITGDTVILPADVDFLKNQLGDPQDFSDETDSAEATPPQTPAKRLFRDTETGMIAGVAAGLAAYLGVDVLIIRLLFVLGLFTGGWGFLVYLILWLLVPEAKTSSERLQMTGQPVTIGSLKAIVDRADVKGAAARANRSLVRPLHGVWRFLLQVVGVAGMVVGLVAFFGLLSAIVYVLSHPGNVPGDSIFPIGFHEHLLLEIALASISIGALFVIIFGMALFQRRWPLHAWVTGLLVGVLFLGLAVSAALAADTVPTVRDRYNANTHTTNRSLPAFHNLDIRGDVLVREQVGSGYSVSLSYYDHPDLSTVKTTVSGDTLVIDTTQYNDHRSCPALCLPATYNLEVTVTAPQLPADVSPDMPLKPAVPIARPLGY